MTATRDLDRQLSAFLEEGPAELPDASFDAVRDRIEGTRQRAYVGPWRVPTVNKLVPIGLGAAAVVAVLVLASRFIAPPTANVGGPATSPSPSPQASASATAAPSATQGLPEGSHTIVDTGAIAGGPKITVAIPASGWTGVPDFGGLSKGPDDDPPRSAMLLWSWPAGTKFYVYGDPCKWKSTAPDDPATTVDEIVAALAAQASRDASDPVDVTVGGYAGKQITLHVPNDAPTRAEAFKDCDESTFASYGNDPAMPNRFHQGPGQVDEFWIVDVGGSIVIIDAMYRPDTPAAVIDEMRAIAESATFE